MIYTANVISAKQAIVVCLKSEGWVVFTFADTTTTINIIIIIVLLLLAVAYDIGILDESRHW